MSRWLPSWYILSSHVTSEESSEVEGEEQRWRKDVEGGWVRKEEERRRQTQGHRHLQVSSVTSYKRAHPMLKAPPSLTPSESNYPSRTLSPDAPHWTVGFHSIAWTKAQLVPSSSCCRCWLFYSFGNKDLGSPIPEHPCVSIYSHLSLCDSEAVVSQPHCMTSKPVLI